MLDSQRKDRKNMQMEAIRNNKSEARAMLYVLINIQSACNVPNFQGNSSDAMQQKAL